MLCITTSPAIYRVDPKQGEALVYRIGYRLTTAGQVLRLPDDAAHIKGQHALFARVYPHWSLLPLRGVGYAPVRQAKEKPFEYGFTVAVEGSLSTG
jgi:hypothetical protein